MKCMICGNEMEDGHLVTDSGGDSLFYLPQGEKLGLPGMFLSANRLAKKGGFNLGGNSLLRLSSVDVFCYHCPNCRKITISY